AERLQHVRRARRRRDGAVAVLRDGCPRGGRDERGGGRDVEGAGGVAARAGRVDEVVALRPHLEDVSPHRLRAAGDLARGLALRARGRDLQLVRDGRGRERVVAPGLELRGKPGEEAPAVMVHRARLAVDEPARGADLPAEGLDDSLVAEADAERRDATPPDEL